MKLIFKTFIAVLFVFTVSSCEEKIDELGVNPDTFPKATDEQMLTSAQGYLGYVVEADLNVGSFLWAQYSTWGIGVSVGNQERFVSEPDDFDGVWTRSYANILTDLKYLTNSDRHAYRGVAKILQAYTYQALVDHFGDIPYTNAIKGEEGVFTPGYDDASEVYASLVVLLDEALADFAQAELLGQTEIVGGATAAIGMGANDLLYGGNLDKWTKFANSLKLRILMRTSEVDPQQTAVETLISTGTFIESASDMPMVPFAAVSGNQNPMWALFEAGVGDFYFASNATLNVLDDLGDPRANAFYSLATTGTFAGQLRGIDQGTIEDEPFTAPSSDYSGSTLYTVAEGNDVMLMSPWEVWFLRAEAAARYGTTDSEVTAFGNAVQANFDYIGLAGGPAYITSLGYSAANPLDTRLDDIAVQKWISMNGTQEDEGWIETRRFDRPASRLFTDGIFQNPPLSVLPPVGGVNQYPAAWLVPASERSLNPNAPAQRVLTDRLFWDN